MLLLHRLPLPSSFVHFRFFPLPCRCATPNKPSMYCGTNCHQPSLLLLLLHCIACLLVDSLTVLKFYLSPFRLCCFFSLLLSGSRSFPFPSPVHMYVCVNVELNSVRWPCHARPSFSLHFSAPFPRLSLFWLYSLALALTIIGVSLPPVCVFVNVLHTHTLLTLCSFSPLHNAAYSLQVMYCETPG